MLVWQDEFLRLFPMYKDLDSRELVKRLYTKAGEELPPEAHPWRKLASALAVALGGPFAVLIFGWALFWASAGFKQSKTP